MKAELPNWFDMKEVFVIRASERVVLPYRDWRKELKALSLVEAKRTRVLEFIQAMQISGQIPSRN